jgi:hypothetical protein
MAKDEGVGRYRDDPRRNLSWFVPGRPTPFAGGQNERAWKEAIARHVPASGQESIHHAVSVEFALNAAREGTRSSDLDNLLDPVLSVVVNRLGWCGGRRPNLAWVRAEKAYRGTNGARIALERGSPMWPPLGIGRAVVDGSYGGDLPRSARDETFAGWVRAAAIGTVRTYAAVRLTFATATVNLGETATGPVKPLLDCLWPVLGGTPAAPEDWRIRVLLLEKGASGVGVEVWAAEMPISCHDADCPAVDGQPCYRLERLARRPIDAVGLKPFFGRDL